jgi:transcriptional regulator with XRE-family HTH domain
MGTNAVRRGPTAATVSANIKRLREQQNLGLRALAKRLADLGRPLSHSALDKIERGTRRVDVDDLMALAQTFNRSPITLLMPETAGEFDQVEVTGYPPEKAARVWDRLRALYLTDIPEDIEFFTGSNPTWALNYGLLADKRTAEDWARKEAGRRGND